MHFASGFLKEDRSNILKLILKYKDFQINKSDSFYLDKLNEVGEFYN